MANGDTPNVAVPPVMQRPGSAGTVVSGQQLYGIGLYGPYVVPPEADPALKKPEPGAPGPAAGQIPGIPVNPPNSGPQAPNGTQGSANDTGPVQVLEQHSDGTELSDEEIKRTLNGATPEVAAQNDVKVVGDPKSTPTELDQSHARIKLLTSLSDEQLAAIGRGDKVAISDFQFRYVKALTGAVDVGFQGKKGMNAFQAFGGTDQPRAGEYQNALHNGLQIISNKNIVSDGKPPHAGGFENLPKTFKSLHDTQYSKFDPGNAVWLPSFTVGPEYEQNLQIAKYMKSGGDVRYKSGTDLDRALLAAGQRYLRVQTGYEQQHPYKANIKYMGDPGWFRRGGFKQRFSEDFFEAASDDKRAFADAVEDPATGYTLVSDILTHHWNDDSVPAQLVHFNIQGVPPSIADPAQQELRGRIMQRFARHMATDESWKTAADVPNSRGADIGRLNPRLLRQLGISLTPYLGTMGGDGTRLPGFPIHGAADQEPWLSQGNKGTFNGLKNIIATINLDKSAGEQFNAAIYAYRLDAERDSYANPNRTILEHEDVKGRLKAAGALQGAVDYGTMRAAQAQNNKDADAAAEAYKWRRAAFGIVLDAKGELLGRVPGAQKADELLSDDDNLADQFIGPEPTSEEAPLKGFDQHATTYNAIAGAADAKAIPSQLEHDYGALFRGGKLRPYSELRGSDIHLMEGLEERLKLVNLPPGSDTPRQILEDEYNRTIEAK
ncbi:MAG: hypothetical protein QM658_04960 [Gordonia sp. (in: high G+C Gram-positive bacteria)]